MILLFDPAGWFFFASFRFTYTEISVQIFYRFNLHTHTRTDIWSNLLILPLHTHRDICSNLLLFSFTNTKRYLLKSPPIVYMYYTHREISVQIFSAHSHSHIQREVCPYLRSFSFTLKEISVQTFFHILSYTYTHRYLFKMLIFSCTHIKWFLLTSFSSFSCTHTEWYHLYLHIQRVIYANCSPYNYVSHTQRKLFQSSII